MAGSQTTRRTLRAALCAAMSVTIVATGACAAFAAAPPNDARDAARDLPVPRSSVQGTLDDSTLEGVPAPTPDQPATEGICGQPVVGDVWYRVTAAAPGRLVIRLSGARPDLDAVIQATRLTRAGGVDAGCDVTDPQGRAGLSVSPSKAGTTYLVRTGQIASSTAESSDFTISVAPAPPDPRWPGLPLPARGARGVVDRLSNTSDAWSAVLREGETYRVNLAHKPTRCVQLRIYSPRASWGGNPSYARGCGGYLLLTPGPGLGGRWSLRVETRGGRYDQDYRLSVGLAGPDDSAPGRVLRDRDPVHDRLEGGRLDAVDLYRLDVHHRSHVVLALRTAADNGFNLRLINGRGRTIRCACGDRGDVQVRKGLRPGRYFVVVRARFRAHGTYTLVRLDRALTGTGLRANGARRTTIRPGQTVTLTLSVHPAVSGPADVRVERYDPLSGWHFSRTFNVTVHNGHATIAFQPPLETTWRAVAHFRGTDKASPSDSRRAYFDVRSTATP